MSRPAPRHVLDRVGLGQLATVPTGLGRSEGPDVRHETVFAADQILVDLAQLTDGDRELLAGWEVVPEPVGGHDDRRVIRCRRAARAGFTEPRPLEALLQALEGRAAPNHEFAGPPEDLTGQPFYQNGPPPTPSTKAEIDWRDLPKPPGGNRVRVAVLDTGVAMRNAELRGHRQGRLLLDEDWVDTLPVDDARDMAAGHGTFITGLIAQRAPEVMVRVRRVLSGAGSASEWEVAQAVEDIGPADILNLSLGGFTLYDQPPMRLREAILQWLDDHEGSVAVVAAGNTGVDRRFWPAALSTESHRVIAVGGVEREGETGQWRPAPFSNYGTAADPWVTACAPASGLGSTFVEAPSEGFDGWAVWSGTSFSTPLVAGAIADQMRQTHLTAEKAWESVRSRGEELVHVDPDGTRRYLGTLVT